MKNESCANCSASLFSSGNGSMGICRAHPPTASVVLIPRGQVQMELVPTPVSSLPQVPRDGWCREWGESKPFILEH